ncbi:Hint domain-containing protein [Streptosporangium sp. NPDC002721]|uniref:Hint domain-containing protein n=1 Tax=Streptosporangium sp. NPDC002721 TaxID=3366188 RepID=UPI0036946387
MPGFAAPGVLFAGNSAAPDRAFYRCVFNALPKDHYTRYVEVGVGSFAATLVAANAGISPHAMESSDVTLYSSIVGTLLSGGDLETLRITLDGEPVELPDADPVAQAAHLLYVHWLARMQAKPEVDYWQSLVIDLVDRADEHRAHLSHSLQGLVDRLPGITFRPQCMWDHIAQVADDPATIIVAAPPTYKCLERSERILTADLQWVACGELKVGDRILAFDEEAAGPRRNWQFATITHSQPAMKECVRVTLGNGDSVVCTTDHPWLASTGPGATRQWIRADELLKDNGRGPARNARYVLRAMDTWEPQRSYEAGWLAGMFDGEGSLRLGNANKLSITQADGPIAELIQSRLTECGFKPASSSMRTLGPLSRKPLANYYVTGGFAEICRVLGELRPERLIVKFGQQALKERAVRVLEHVEVVSIEPVGPTPVQSISTSARTYIGQGYLMHNSGFEKFFDTGGRIEWAEPPYSIFDPETDMQRLADDMEGKAALLMFLQEDRTGQAAHPRPVFAHPLGPGSCAYVISNRPDEIFTYTGGPKVALGAPRSYQPAPLPIIPPDHEVTDTSTIQLISVKGSECDYYRSLWMHRLSATPGSYNLLVALDGYAAGVIGYGAETMTRPFPHGKSRWQSHLLLRFAFGAPTLNYRLTRLITMLALRRDTAKQVFTGQSSILLAASHGLVTVEMTRHPEVKGLRGLMTLEKRDSHPDGYKLSYRADWTNDSIDDIRTRFLTKEKTWRKARRQPTA